MASLEVKVEVRDAPIVLAHFAVLKARTMDFALGAAVMSAGIMGLVDLIGISALWYELPLIGLLFYRMQVTTKRFKKQLAADESAYEIAMDGE
jgi:hypothetical protein